MYTKRIVCLANSFKPPSGRCVAGRELLNDGLGDWIRPVSTRPSREISEEERRYEDGRDVRVLDIVDVHLDHPEPELHQVENHVIDGDYYWELAGRLDWNSLAASIEDVETLWVNGSSSSQGVNDRVAEAELVNVTSSLALVRPHALRIEVAEEGGVFGPVRRRVRARFELGNAEYRVSVTDPHVKRAYLRGDDGAFAVNEAILCVSLAEPFHGSAYKLAAAVITPQRAAAG